MRKRRPATPSTPAAVTPLGIAAALNRDAAPAPGASGRSGGRPPRPVSAPPRAGPGGDDEDDATERALPFAERTRRRVGRESLLVFRVGSEHFAFELPAVEEAMDIDGVHPLPEMPPGMLGVCDLRGRMLPVHSAGAVLGVTPQQAGALLVLSGPSGRVGLCVDDVEDVVVVERASFREPPRHGGHRRQDALLLAVTRQGGALVSVLDADAVAATCLIRRPSEAA